MNIEKLRWSDDAAHALAPVMGLDADGIQHDVESGAAELYRIDGTSYLVTRVEGDALIVCCYIGEDLREAARHIVAAAKRAGLKTVQYHTETKGLARLLDDLGGRCIGRYYIYAVEVH